MKINFRNYTSTPGITEDYHKVREFLLKLGYAEYTYARWDWMITHPALDEKSLDKIGIWEVEGEMVGLAIYDTSPGAAFCLALPEYKDLKKEILLYAKENLKSEKGFWVVISDLDKEFQTIAAELGFIGLEAAEKDAIFISDKDSTDYELPEGYSIVSMDKELDFYKYTEVLWKGFDHELDGDGPLVYTDKEEKAARKSMIRDNVDLSMKFAVKDAEGNFVAYCGMWYDEKAKYGVIEPVATAPEFRKLGLGKAAVLEGIKKVKDLGAEFVTVGSSQQFYYSIGMRPHATNTYWRMKK